MMQKVFSFRMFEESHLLYILHYTYIKAIWKFQKKLPIVEGEVLVLCFPKSTK